ncbi:MAG: zinc dependent phospholipase C family protein [Clostridiales bacterium]|nr:zinc dependent phospholipase C family protein [Clostridiales bacterium]
MTAYGEKLHWTRARSFFEKGMEKVRDTGDPSLAVYLLGFGCHYILDCACHPYVNQMDETGAIGHAALENELDRQLMQKDGKDPLQYRPAVGIVASRENARVIQNVFPELSVQDILTSLKMMRRITDLLVCDDGGRRQRGVDRVLSLFGKERTRFTRERFMTPCPPVGCTIQVRKLEKLMGEAGERAPGMLMELYVLGLEEGHLSGRWNLTYNG